MFSVEERDALRERVLRLAEEDARVVAGRCGRIARARRWRPLLRPRSHLLRRRRGVRSPRCSTSGHARSSTTLDAVHLTDLERRADDVPRVSAAECAAVRPLDDAASRSSVPCRSTISSCSSVKPASRRREAVHSHQSRGTSSGGASSTRCTLAFVHRARAPSGRPSTTSVPCGTTHSRSPAFARGSGAVQARGLRRPRPPRRSRASRRRTSPRSSLARSGPPSPQRPRARARGVRRTSSARGRRRVSSQRRSAGRAERQLRSSYQMRAVWSPLQGVARGHQRLTARR